ncbi:hypothetical protein CPJCM30710_01570 [Clostridium polyendosporum]|uniref:Uncharacterized protein n=1 Tax=Clostridium polyendosporum TaxID=69208 RepID=A0A919RXC1_9CLOT|nr:DUF6762 family protein [Clostridium polyendosporum]GIM27491.1 hypothetical protein CPJCM30710_01570 [Clostridium polyendosporum]
MDFSSLVLMEKDGATGMIIKELGSYTVNEGAAYVTKLYCIDGDVSLFFDTKKDVEEWEYSAIFDLFEKEAFNELAYDIEEKDDEYNPTWVVKFKYDEEHEEMRAVINEVCNLIKEKIEKVFQDIIGKEEEYQ